MLGSLPKFADKNFIIGYFLPALLAVLAGIWTFFPGAAVFASILDLKVGEDAFGHLAYLVLAVWVLSILLMTMNFAQYRILEGYLPPVSWLVPLKWWQQWRFRKLSDAYETLGEEQKAVEKKKETDTDAGAKETLEEARLKIIALRSDRKIELLTFFPSPGDDILPTRFGNIISAFESYPREAYGVDAISVWLRLGSVVPKRFAAAIEDARAQVDCFVNVFYLSLAIAAAAIGQAASLDWSSLGVVNLEPAGLRLIVIGGVGVLIAWLSYRAASARAIAWGDLVKSAFDCYLPALARQLGYKLPHSADMRRDFWIEFARFVTYQRPMTKGRWTFDGGGD